MKEVSVSVARITLGDLVEEISKTGESVRIVKGRAGREQVSVILSPEAKKRKPRVGA
jgi:hypothetical protein